MLELSFIDLDHYIEGRYHKTVSQLFAEKGEEAFRDIERRMLPLAGIQALGWTHRCLSAAGTFFLMARVTNHAARRTKERLGLSKKLSHKNAENALRYGIRHSDTSGSLNRYISALYWKHETANNVRIYCNNVYIFHGETLITIFPLPQKYRKTAARINRKTTERGDFDENS